jgi:hypothetical protein
MVVYSFPMQGSKPRTFPALTSLSARLLILAIFFVMLAEVLIYASSIARYRKTYLEEHINKAHLVTLAVTLGPSGELAKELEKCCLRKQALLALRLKGIPGAC